MRASICCIAALMGAMGIATDAAAENNSSLAPLIHKAQTSTATKARVIGVCSPSPSNIYSAENGLAPLTSAQAYFRLFEHRSVTGSVTTTILQQPKHGVLRLITEADGNTYGEGRFVPSDQLYVYLPDSGYLGTDTGSILVDFGGGG